MSSALVVLAAAVAVDAWAALLLAAFLPVLLALSLIDATYQRLPNPIVGWTAALSSVYIVVASLLGAPLRPLGGLIGMATFGGSLFAISLLSRGGMGMGDVKLAAVIGLIIGSLDVQSVAVAAGVAILTGGLSALFALLLGSDRKTAIPFGPMLALGALASALAGPALADAYLGLFR